MKILVTVAAFLSALTLYAQEQTLEVEPITVTGTFELRRPPPASDSFLRFFEKQIETKQAEQAAAPQLPIWNAAFWRFLPRLEPSMDSGEFLTPNYSTVAYREAARKMDEMSRHSIFDK